MTKIQKLVTHWWEVHQDMGTVTHCWWVYRMLHPCERDSCKVATYHVFKLSSVSMDISRHFLFCIHFPLSSWFKVACGLPVCWFLTPLFYYFSVFYPIYFCFIFIISFLVPSSSLFYGFLSFIFILLFLLIQIFSYKWFTYIP